MRTTALPAAASRAAMPAMLAACAVAPLIAYNLTPNATLFNQLAALAGWGLVLLLLPGVGGGVSAGARAAQAALLLMLAAAAASPAWTGLPASLAVSSAVLIAAAWLVLSAAARLRPGAALTWWAAFCWALLAAGLASVAVSLIQVFAPELADGVAVARSGIVGRAVGNLRQPNHLASLMMWACVAALWLAESGRLTRPVAGARWALPLLLFGFVFTVVLSASRTGMLGVLVLAVWGLLDRKLSRASRLALLLTPLMLALSWGLMWAWAHLGAHAFGAESRLAEGAGSPSRLAILRNTWALLQMHPWTGVGWGEFNLAWSMTPFPDRPIAFFDHCHNLPMQLLVELGWPLGLLVLGLLSYALWALWRASRRAEGERAALLRAAFMLVLTIGLHSLLEYPLWYAYFLLPTAFALGLGLASDREAESTAAAGATGLLLRASGPLLIAGSLYAGSDYLKLVEIYAPSENAAPLSRRIERGQRSPFFSTQADYAAATSYGPSANALAATRRTAHNLIDARLMMMWSQSLAAAGDVDRARHVAQRLREFRPTGAPADWLDECEAAPEAGASRPFQCEAPSRSYGWQELR